MSISRKRIHAIFVKQCKEVRKNPPVLISFLMAPILAIIVNSTMDGDASEMILSMFYPMHIVMSGLLSCAAIMAEEKEKNTLRVLIMNMVKPSEYVLGIGLFVFIGQTIGAVLLFASFGISGESVLPLLGVTVIGNICSILLGSLIGIIVKNQISVAPFVVPTMLVLIFIPIFAQNNQDVASVGKYIYSQQLSNLIGVINRGEALQAQSFIIMAMNVLFFMALFMFVYRRNKLDE